MSYQFKFCGGVHKPRQEIKETFLLFFVVDGHEISMTQARKDNLVQNESESGVPALQQVSALSPNRYTAYNDYRTNIKYGKIFCQVQGFGIPRQYQSFYFAFKSEEDVPVITVKNFPTSVASYEFIGKIRFLKKSEALGLLDVANDSYKFLKLQPLIAAQTIRAMITVDRTILRQGIRQIRIGRRRTKKHVVNDLLE